MIISGRWLSKAFALVVLSVVFWPVSFAADTPGSEAPPFVLLNGQGVPVCKAYLERLNNTKFIKPPYCDRPEVVGMKGFATLNRVYLTAEEIYPIYGKVDSFYRTSDQTRYSTDKLIGPDRKGAMREISLALKTGQLTVWRYNPMVDVDNDGKPDNVVIWYRGRCGSAERFLPNQWAFIFDKQTNSIDEKKTREVFGNPSQEWPGLTRIKRFRFIELPNTFFGVFTYKGVTYFDTFPFGRTYGSRIRGDVDLRVRLRERGRTQVMCEYHWTRRDR